ncbi:hypothetical protein [Vacuolonema iberomarrocanum]|uniref:hypothetical protein n=1 Tax=Vacuolonema iberomarrocanum TaxID=3454632 RepID=UPI001A054B33|nr:hypothetical protein [filamentous cyanobacterium LEGE 07170]
MRATPIAACALAVLALDDVARADTQPVVDAANANALAVVPSSEATQVEKMEAIAPLATPERATPERAIPEREILRVGRSLPRTERPSPAPQALPNSSSTSPEVAAGVEAEATGPTVVPMATISEPEFASSTLPIASAATVPPTPPQPDESQAVAVGQPIPAPEAQSESGNTQATPPQQQAVTFQPPTGDAAQLVQPDGSFIVADVPPPPPSADEIEALQEQLREIEDIAAFGDVFAGSPAITLAVPSGYGADDGIGFITSSFQSSVRGSDEADATATFGIGLGDAEDAVGVQLSYTIASFGTNRDFGTGGFNAKVHRRLSDNFSIAAGWDGFISVGDDTDFEDSVYSAVTYVGELRPDINDAFSRIALTAGIGNGRFRTEDAILDDDDTIGVFGSAALRIARPVSAIVEWTGQDLALGLSIAPFPDFPLVITPALRDVAGAGDDVRFVLGANLAFRF